MTERKPVPIGVVIGPFSATLFALHRGERLVGQRRARCLHHVDAGLLHVPVERDTGRLENAARRLRQLGAGAVAGDESHAVRHCARQRTHTRLRLNQIGFNGSCVRSPPMSAEQRLPPRSRRRHRVRDRDRRARQGRRLTPLSRHRHRRARRPLPVRERLGPARRRGHQLAAAADRGDPACRTRAAPCPPTSRRRSRRSARSGACRSSSTSTTSRRATISRGSRRRRSRSSRRPRAGSSRPCPSRRSSRARTPPRSS